MINWITLRRGNVLLCSTERERIIAHALLTAFYELKKKSWDHQFTPSHQIADRDTLRLITHLVYRQWWIIQASAKWKRKKIIKVKMGISSYVIYIYRRR